MIELIIGLLILMSGTDYNDQVKTLAIRSDPKSPQEVIVSANNDFSFTIFNILSKDENDVMSSLSILSALSILMNGAKGETLADLKKFLGFQSSNEVFDEQTINEGFQLISQKYQDSVKSPLEGNKPSELMDLNNFKHRLNIANKVINDRKIKLNENFSNNVNQYFRADIQTGDFHNNNVEETNKVNDWVRNQTNNKIQKLFDILEKDTTMLIINVLYFNGQWEEKFYNGSNQNLDFYNNGITPVKTEFMRQTDPFKYADSEQLNAQILELDYIGNQISFVIVLPKERNGLKTLKQKINSKNFDKAIKSMTRRNTEVIIPKFKIENSYELMEKINPKPIALTKQADLSGLSAEPQIVSKILHKVFIEVNEKGTEAAAVTAIKMVLMSARIYPETLLFKADHPFLFFIRDKTNGIILFSGQINKL